MSSDFGNPLRKFKLVFLGEQSGRFIVTTVKKLVVIFEKLVYYSCKPILVLQVTYDVCGLVFSWEDLSHYKIYVR